jgi:CHASE2 domain-containing sensor protein
MSSAIGPIRQLASKGLVHWLSVTLTVTAGLYVGHLISDARMWLEWRYIASRSIQQLTHRVPIVKYTTVVTIGTAEYWKPPLSARVPIHRGYLANLVRVIAEGNPFLIALDFDMRSPQPDGSQVEIREFEPETRDLITQLRATAENHHIVLPMTIWNESERYRLDSGVWDLDPDLLKLPNVHGGYIALPPDLRQVPLAVPLTNADPLDSFSLAIAEARASTVTDLLSRAGGRKNLPFASYIPESEFPTHTAQEVLTSGRSTLRDWFAGQLIIVGGVWSVLAAHRGPRADTYLTPAGVMPGVFIHANFVEALLDQRTFEPAPEWVVATLEVVLVLVCTIVFGLDVKTRTKLATCAFVFSFLIVANYVALQNLGRFFDFFVPLVGIMSHVTFEQVNEWRHQAHAHRRCPPCIALPLLATLATTSTLLVGCEVGAQANRAASHQVPGRASSVTQVVQEGVELADPAKPGGAKHGADAIDRPIDPMAPVVQEGVESADPAKPGGAKHGADAIDRPIDPMAPVVQEGVESADPAKPGGAKHGADAIDRPIDPMGPAVQEGVESADPAKPGGVRHDADATDRDIDPLGPGGERHR